MTHAVEAILESQHCPCILLGLIFRENNINYTNSRPADGKCYTVNTLDQYKPMPYVYVQTFLKYINTHTQQIKG